jgi:hypothetical protein
MRAFTLVMGLAVLGGCAGDGHRGDPADAIADKRASLRSCPIHDQPLVEDVVPIYYGWGDYLDSTIRHQHDAPFALFYAVGPCGHGPDAPKRARILCCSECRAVWTASEPRPRGESHTANGPEH